MNAYLRPLIGLIAMRSLQTYFRSTQLQFWCYL